MAFRLLDVSCDRPFAGVTLAPAVAAVLMSVSSIVVAANAQVLRRVPLGQQ